MNFPKEQRDKLRKLALAATPGPFNIERRDGDSGDLTYVVHGGVGDFAWCSDDLDLKARHNAAYIAAAHSNLLLTLLDDLDVLEDQREILCEAICASAPLSWAASCDMAGAEAWEKKAHAALNAAGHPGPAKL